MFSFTEAAQIFFFHCIASTSDVSESDGTQPKLVENHEIRANPLPPGYRFRPTDEEIIIHFLRKKIEDPAFKCRAVLERDVYSFEPDQLNDIDGVNWSDQECYYFTKRVKKCPTGTRNYNRTTKEGYWKFVGREKEISSKGILVGMRKALVFYQGRTPTATKTIWRMHEYVLPDRDFQDWVVCRVYTNESPESESGKNTTKLELESSSSSKVLPTPARPVLPPDIGSNRIFGPHPMPGFGSTMNYGPHCMAHFSATLDPHRRPMPNFNSGGNSNTKYVQNQHSPARSSTVADLRSNIGSSGNFGPHTMPDFDSNWNFVPHFMPDVDFTATHDPHCRPMANLNSAGNLDPHYMSLPHLNFSATSDPHHMQDGENEADPMTFP